jgi:nucleotide-binding universal stress UspA family protein
MYNNILVPVVFDEDNSTKIQAAVAVAQTLADEGAKITLLHVLEQVPGYAASYLAADFTQQAREQIEAELKALAADIPGAMAQVITGHSGRSILDYIADNGSDLVIIASHRPGMQDFLIGSTAAQVVRHAPCAVHVLR